MPALLRQQYAALSLTVQVASRTLAKTDSNFRHGKCSSCRASVFDRPMHVVHIWIVMAIFNTSIAYETNFKRRSLQTAGMFSLFLLYPPGSLRLLSSMSRASWLEACMSSDADAAFSTKHLYSC